MQARKVTLDSQLVESIIYALENGDFATGYCMCGSPVDSHGLGDGHAPTEAGEYYVGQMLEELRKCLSQE